MKKTTTAEPAKIKTNGTTVLSIKKNGLAYSAMSLKAILDVTDDALIVYDKDLKLITHNKSFSRLVNEFGDKRLSEDFDLFDLASPARKEIIRKKINTALKGQIVNYHVMYDYPVKRWFHIHIYPVKTNGTDVDAICIAVRDVTQQKKNHEALVYQSTLLNTIDVSVVSTDLDFRIIEINEAAEKIFGLTGPEIIGRVHQEVFNFEFTGTSLRQVYRCVQDTGKWTGEVVYQHPDGRKIIIKANVSSVYDETGKKIGYVGVDKDITEQRKAEEKVRRSETYMKSILESTPEALMLLNASYDIIAFNPRAHIVLSKFLKVSVEEGQNLIAILPDFRKEDAKQKLDYACHGNFIEYEVQYPDGSWLLVSFSPVKSEEGQSIEICVGLRDISLRKKTEYALRKNDQQYRSLVDSLSEGVIFQSFDKRIITFNDSAIEILGVEKDDLQRYGFPLPNCIAINEKKEKLDIKEIIRDRVFEGHPVRGLVAGIENNEGAKWLCINIEPVRNEEGLAYAYVITFNDITATFKSREELSLLSKVVKETSNIVVITDNNERIIWANDAFTKISEYTLEEAQNKKPGWLLKGPEKDQKEVDKIKAAVKNQVPVRGSILNYTKNGNKYWSQYNIHPVHDENGKLVKFFSIQTDITESKRMQEEIAHQKEIRQREKTRASIRGQEKERNEVGQELHDNIQQILGAAKLQLDCAKSMAPDNLEYIQNGIDNINLSIEEIRRFSKRLVAPRFRDSKLTDEIDNQVGNLGLAEMVLLDVSQFNERAITDDLKLVLFRIIQEQLTNILKHAKANSITIRLENDDNCIALEIIDDGVGFDPVKKRNGIGLSNIYNRVELSGGSAKIQSAPGMGCKLLVTVPLKNEEFIKA